MKWEWNVAFSRYGESWRLARKLLDGSLRPAVVAAYRPLLQTKAHVLLTQVLANPDELEAHLNQFVVFPRRRQFAKHCSNLSSLSGSIILALAYGYEVKETSDPKVEVARKLVQLSGDITLPGALLVNDIPLCKCFLWC
jgi:hypothetical protein